jgi:hypothetical protein
MPDTITPLHDNTRKQAWPKGADLTRKLLSSNKDLEKTSRFITTVGMKI